MRKSVATFGFFATGLIAGYMASLFSGKSCSWSPVYSNNISRLSVPKILPTIPDFDKERISIDIETSLKY